MRVVTLAALFYNRYLCFWPKAELTNPKISIDFSSAMQRTAEPAWLDC
jgi:hypothetical protein